MPSNLDQFPSKYDSSCEKEMYQLWTQHDLFHTETVRVHQEDAGFAVDEQFCIPLPPPNVTGKLHLGHAMMLSVEDTMIRHARMLGKETLWIPGTDHAGISTQVVVEKNLFETENKTRHDIGREAFLGKMRDWVKIHRSTIVNQTKSMGSSLDRHREQFSMSEQLSRAVRKSFSILYHDHKVYHDSYIINRCPRCQTVLSDLETDYKDKDAQLNHLRYFIADANGQPTEEFLTVATIRPETIFGDVAVAVHPEDSRYQHLIGKKVLIPLVNRPIPVIADPYVEMDFGTGALKITPCHDPHDFEIGEKHKLDLNRYAFQKNGTFTELAGQYADKSVEASLSDLYAELESKNILTHKEPYSTKIPQCDRCATRVEPMVSQQWFVNVQDGAKWSIDAVNSDEVHIHPPRYNKNFFNWMENIRPRCISRQLWRGHRIPVRYCDDCKHKNVFDEDSLVATLKKHSDKQHILLTMIAFNLIADSRLHNPFDVEEFFALLNEESLTPQEGNIRNVYAKMYRYKYADDAQLLEEIALFETIMKSGDKKTLDEMLKLQCGLKIDNTMFVLDFICEKCVSRKLEQDPDVLDTRYSSGLWPFSILGWPEKTPDLEKYYPNTVLETGGDILTFWVARMMTMGHGIMKQKPFSHIYLHGLIRDSQGQKMSKSKGNGVDPLDVIEKYGADALRLGILVGSTPGNDIKYFEERVEYFWRFLNKLWNASRFVLMKTEATGMQNYTTLAKTISENADKLNAFDHRILNRINDTIEKSAYEMDNFMLGEFAQRVIDLVRHDFCDWYIEISKQEAGELTNTVLLYATGTLLKLLHPFIPHVTEKIWQSVPFEGFLMVQVYPKIVAGQEQRGLVDDFMEMVSFYRNLRVEAGLKQQDKCLLSFNGNVNMQNFIQNHSAILKKLTQAEEIIFGSENEGFVMGVFQDMSLGVKTNQVIDNNELKSKLLVELENKKSQVIKLEAQLGNEKFVGSAPAQVIQDRKDSLEEAKKTIAGIEDELAKL